jgi:NADPH:quinone reductase-like Zn-dependent oxidoreductase
VVDIKLRKNPISSIILPKPKVPGTDISGVVTLAPDGCLYPPGTEVIAMMPLLFWTFGSSAEYAAVPISLLALKPKNINFIEAAALPLVSTTVVTGFSLVLDAIGEGDTALVGAKILVHAGGGGVGSFAIQYAKNGIYIYTVR